MLLYVVLLIAVCAVSNISADCPRDEYIVPLGCTCRAGGRMQCTAVQDETKFEMIMAACKGYQLLGFVLVNAKLDWLPPNTFHSINTLEFALSNSVLQSLTKPIAGARLFKGSGIENFIIDRTEIHDGDLSQIGDLDDLKQLVIRGYSNPFFLEHLIHRIRDKAVNELILENIPHLIRRGDEIAPLNHLRTLSLSGLSLDHIGREDLPQNVEHLENLWLKDNNLVDLPDDLLHGMTNLHMLDLSSNKFKTLRAESLATFDQYIVLHGNPLVCDWRLDWLRQRLLTNSLKVMTPQPIKCDDGSNLIKSLSETVDSGIPN